MQIYSIALQNMEITCHSFPLAVSMLSAHLNILIVYDFNSIATGTDACNLFHDKIDGNVEFSVFA